MGVDYNEGFEAGLRSATRTMHDQLAALHRENERLRETIGCYEAMKEGVGIRIAGIEAKIKRLQESLTRMMTVTY